MSVTLGSWWQSRDTDEKMAVGSYPGSKGFHQGRVPCFVAGRGCNLLWLTPSEIRGGWKHWRPTPDKTPKPAWLVEHLDVIYGASPAFWLRMYEIKRGWIRLSGLMTEPALRTKLVLDTVEGGMDVVHPFDWGIQRYDTFFAPLSEALRKLKPRFAKLSAWDRVDSGGPV